MLSVLLFEHSSTPLRFEYSCLHRGDRPADFMNREIEVASVDIHDYARNRCCVQPCLGKTVEYQQIPFEVFEQQIGEELTTMFRWFENVGYAADLAQLKRDFPTPTNFESYLRDRDWQN
jgi:hypothetical protein